MEEAEIVVLTVSFVSLSLSPTQDEDEAIEAMKRDAEKGSLLDSEIVGVLIKVRGLNIGSRQGEEQWVLRGFKAILG